MTFRSNDEVILNELKVVGSSNRILNLLKWDGMDRYENLAFDYDSREEPCASSYPRHTKCCFDNTFDFFTMKVKPHYSLLAGHVTKRMTGDNIVQGLKLNGSIRATSQLTLRTGDDRLDGTKDPLMIYYGKNCDKNICTYEKVAQLVAKDHSTTYSAFLPDFDWENDQLIMDYRSSDRLNVVQSTFKACNANGCGGDFDLTKFGTTDQELPAWDYDSPEEPCGERSYSGYICQYDAVYDFKKMQKYLEKSVFVGQ